MPTDIRKFTLEQLIEEFKTLNWPVFKARQVYEWLWKKGCKSFNQMRNLSKENIVFLEKNYCILPIEINQQQKSSDGTIKCSFKLYDGYLIEGVLIPTSTRTTACVSSQVGCSLDCKFCATGFLKRERNLDASEIYDQVFILNQLAETNYGKRLDNIVYMGMGEPLLNYSNVMRSLDLLTNENALHFSAQRITISTAGIAKMIMKLADDGVKSNLALSLHAANNEKRSAIMPINDSNNLEMLAEALAYWVEKTDIRPTLEYTVIENVNDSLVEAEELVQFAKKFPSKINLIEYNPISLANFLPTSSKRLDIFAKFIEKSGVIVNVRRSRGKDIDAACGQLVNKN